LAGVGGVSPVSQPKESNMQDEPTAPATKERLSVIESRVDYLLDQVTELRAALARSEELLTQAHSPLFP
jgi:hypothetical protein